MVALPLAVYGTLRPGGGALERVGVAEQVRRIGPCVLHGHLYELDWYPGFVEGEGRVAGELLEVPNDAALAALDAFERYSPADPDGSLYLRKRVWLIEPQCEAWTYIYNRPVDNAPHVEGGDWLAWKAARV